MKMRKSVVLAGALMMALASFGVDLDLLKELVEIPSSSVDIPQVNRTMSTMKAYLEKRGLFCTIETNEKGSELLYASTKREKTPDYMLSCHLDVVPAAFEGHYTLKNENGRLTGRGVYDDKGMVVAVVDTLCTFAGTGASIGCIFGADEELGGFTTTWMVEKKGYRPRKMVIVVDAAYKKLFYAHKGQLMVNVAIRGRSGHSSRPWVCDDSITKLMEGYVKLRAEWDRRHPKTDDHWYDVMTPTVVKSEGTALNRIPALVELNLNLRSVHPEAKDELVNLCKETFAGAEVTVVRYSPPVESDPSDPYLRRFKAAMDATFGEDIPLDRGLAATDARCFVSCGVPMAVVGIEGGDAHGSTEWATVEGIEKTAACLTAFFKGEMK